MPATDDDATHPPDSTPGVVFRAYAGEGDLPGILRTMTASRRADGVERASTLDALRAEFTRGASWDPHEDAVVGEAGGEVVAFGRLDPFTARDGAFYGYHACWVDPVWRGRGVGRELLHRLQRRVAKLAAERGIAGARLATMQVEGATAGIALLRSEGHEPTHSEFDMVRPSLDDIPDLPLPPGLEVRPVRPEHHRAIWEANAEAFADAWLPSPPTEERYRAWLADPVRFAPDLWQVAWDGDAVAGSVLGWIDEAENKAFGRSRGYSEGISVRRPYRGRGLASALISRTLAAFRDRGMTEAALSVDTQNPSGAVALYRRLGFEVVRSAVFLERPLSAPRP